MKAQVELNTSISPISTAAEIWNNPDVVVINENFSSTSSDSPVSYTHLTLPTKA